METTLGCDTRCTYMRPWVAAGPLGLDAKLYPPKSRATQMDGESFSQPTSASASSPRVGRKRTRNYSETLWPKRVKAEEANTLFAMIEGAWDTIESVTIWGKKYEYMQHHECNYDLTLCNSTFKIKSNNYKVNLACRPVQRNCSSRPSSYVSRS